MTFDLVGNRTVSHKRVSQCRPVNPNQSKAQKGTLTFDPFDVTCGKKMGEWRGQSTLTVCALIIIRSVSTVRCGSYKERDGVSMEVSMKASSNISVKLRPQTLACQANTK